VFFEGGSILGGPYSEADTDRYLLRFEDNESYNGWGKELFPILTEKKIPILLGDLQEKALLQKAESMLLNFTEILGGVGGVAMTLSEGSGGVLTRKAFLKKAGGTLLSIWGFSGLAGEVLGNSLRDLTSLPWVNDLRKMAAFTEFSHPEDIVVNFRNALIAEKLLYYSEIKKAELGRKPNIAVIMGLGHELMSEYLRAGREFCQNYLSLYPDFFLRHLFGDEGLEKTFSGVFELTPTINLLKLRALRDPELEKRFGLKSTGE
ncbi:hypothetical protein HY502_03295, partial [Candidatus Woesebacteria bacterium]|nr:hypothetical protein [Candidatus Woesebacteria bacterium]